MAADVDTDLDNWSTTAASNSPSGSTTISTNLDDNLREIQAKVRTLRSTGTIASAATTDLSTVEDNYITVTGTTTITALGTLTAGMSKVLIFSGALTLTHNATSLILPGAENYTTAAGDIAVMLSLGSGNWRCLGITNASSEPYDANNVNIDGGTIDGTVIGGTTPAAGTFTDFNCTGIVSNSPNASLLTLNATYPLVSSGVGNNALVGVSTDAGEDIILADSAGSIRFGTNAGAFNVNVGGDASSISAANSALAMSINAAGNIDFQDGTITTTGALTCGTFTSTGIDDNSASTALTLDSSQNATFAGDVKLSIGDLEVTGVAATAVFGKSGADSTYADPQTTTSRTISLQKHGTVSSTGGIVSTVWNNTAGTGYYSPMLSMARSRGASVGTHGLVLTGDELGSLTWQGSDGVKFINAAKITAKATGTPALNDMAGQLEFYTNTGTTTASGLALTLDSSQNATFAGGVSFSGDSAVAANLLDDYEEGTWTPELWDTTNSGSEGQTYSAQVGKYTKIGNTVFIQAELNVTSTGTLTGTDGARIGGLPFTTANTTDDGGIVCHYATSLNLSGAFMLTGETSPNATNVLLREWSSTAGVSNCTVTEFSAGLIRFTGQYKVA